MTECRTVEEYMQTLRQQLKLGKSQTDEILEEVEGNFGDHRARMIAEGHTEDEATALALEELGNPYELAAKMNGVVMPRSDRPANAFRCIVALLIAIALLPAWFYLRSWEQIGFTPRLYLFILGFLMPPLLLIWPGIAWRRNWMFYIYPGALVLLLAALLLGSLVSVSGTVTFDMQDPSAVPAGDAGMSEASRSVLAAMCGLLVVVTLGMMQRKRQRLAAMAAMLTYCAVVEIPIQAEELMFRKQADRMRQYVEDYHGGNGRYPGTEEANADNRDLLGRTYVEMRGRTYVSDGGDFTLSRGRMSNSGFELYYYSWDDEFVSTD